MLPVYCKTIICRIVDINLVYLLIFMKINVIYYILTYYDRRYFIYTTKCSFIIRYFLKF